MNRCKCGALMVWAHTPKGKAIPLDPEPRKDGNLVLVRGIATPVDMLTPPSLPRYASHFATCPHARDFRGSR